MLHVKANKPIRIAIADRKPLIGLTGLKRSIGFRTIKNGIIKPDKDSLNASIAVGKYLLPAIAAPAKDVKATGGVKVEIIAK